MEVPCNQTWTNMYDFQYNEFNCTQHFNRTPIEIDHNCESIKMAFCGVIFFIAFPGLCFALYKLCSQVRPDQVAPVYVINLLISDLIQVSINLIVSTVWLVFQDQHYRIDALVLSFIYLYSLQVNVFFMMCISAERYIMIAHAGWYRNVQTRRTSVIVSVLMWVLSAVLLIPAFILKFNYGLTSVLFVPYPMVMFFFVATWRALSRTSVPGKDQFRIRSILALLLLIYTILFLPFIITLISLRMHAHMPCAPDILLALNPLFDLLLYVFLRRDVKDDLRGLLFCFRKKAEDKNTNVSCYNAGHS